MAVGKGSMARASQAVSKDKAVKQPKKVRTAVVNETASSIPKGKTDGTYTAVAVGEEMPVYYY